MPYTHFRLVRIISGLILTLLFFAIGTIDWFQERANLEQALVQESADLRTTAEIAIADMEQQMLGLATLIAADREVQRLFWLGREAIQAEGGGAGGERSAALRQALYDRLSPAWRDMQSQFGLRQLHFHLGPGSLSYLRVHSPNRYGDRMDGLRHIIVDVNRDQQPRSGFETGRIYSGVRGVVPVWYTDEEGVRHHVGTLEAGTSFDAQLARLDEQIGAGFAVILNHEHVEQAVWEEFRALSGPHAKEGCRCYLEASSAVQAHGWMEEGIFGPLAAGGMESRLLAWQGRDWHLSRFPLRDYLGDQNPSRRHVGSILIWRDKSEAVAALQARQWQSLALLLLVYLLTLGGVGWLLRFTRRSLQHRIDTATAALRESEGMLQRAQAVAHMGSWCHDLISGEIEWSPEAREILGFSPGLSPDYLRFLDCIHPADREHVQAAWQAALRGAPYDIEHRVLVDGRTRWVREQAKLTVDDDGQPHSALGTVQDITEAKEVELALRESEERYRTTFAAVNDGMWEWHVPSGMVKWDNRCYQMLGYSPGAFVVDLAKWRELIHPEDVDKAYAEVERQLAKGEIFVIEFRYHCANGGWLWIQGRGKVVAWRGDQPLRVVGTHTDISARKRAEDELKAMARRNELLLTAAGEGIYGVDLQGNATFINPAALQMLGYREEEILACEQHNVFHHSRPDGSHYPECDCPVHLTLQDGQTRRTDEEWFIRKDGSFFPITLTVAAIGENGERSGAVALFQDMTARRAMEQALQQAGTRLATVIENFHGGILLEDETRHIVLTNRTFCELFAIPVSPDALVGADCSGSAMQSKGLFARPEEFVARIDTILTQRKMVLGEELSMADGRVLERDYVPIIGEHGFQGHLWIYRDISERKAGERELRRLATTDTLTGLPNRRYFLERLDQELGRFHRHHKVVALAMLDIDHFKRVNDSYGHAAGDAVLRHFAELLPESLRKTDLAGRLGGEEFAVLLPGSDLDGAQVYAERLRERVATTPCQVGEFSIKYTISIGVTLFVVQDESHDQPLARADDGLYRAKENGRNRVELVAYV